MSESHGINWQAQLANMQLQHHHLTDQVGFVTMENSFRWGVVAVERYRKKSRVFFCFPKGSVCLKFSSLHNRLGIFTLKWWIPYLFMDHGSWYYLYWYESNHHRPVIFPTFPNEAHEPFEGMGKLGCSTMRNCRWVSALVSWPSMEASYHRCWCRFFEGYE